MIRLNIVIKVTNINKSVHQEAGDRPEVKRVSSGAKWWKAVIAFSPWVAKLISIFFGGGGFDS